MHDQGTRRWSEAARGLELHRTAIVVRVLVVAGAILYTIVQLATPHGHDSGVFPVVLGLAEIAATIMALVGVARFSANGPREVTSLAMLAVFCLVVVLGAQVYGVWVAWKLMQFLSGAAYAQDAWAAQDIMSHVRHLPTIQLVSALAGLVAVVVVLGAFGGLGRVVATPELAARARRLTVAVIALAATYGGIMHWAQHGRDASPAQLLGVGALLAIFGIAVLVAYVATLSWAARCLRERKTGLPPARLV